MLLVGLRPTVGPRVKDGYPPPPQSIRDTPGPMARGVTDMAIMLECHLSGLIRTTSPLRRAAKAIIYL